MAKLSIAKGATSVLARIFILDSASTVGAGKTGLTAASFTGTKVYVARDDDGNAAATSVTLSDATRGTWSSGGIKEKDATNQPGVYEFGVTNASLATGSRSCTYLFIGTGIAPCPLEIELTGTDNQDAVHGGMSALPNAAAAAAGGLPTVGTGTGQISVAAGLVTLAAVTHTGAVIPTVTTLTNLPAITADWLTGTGVDATAVTKIQAGLTPPTVGAIDTQLSGTHGSGAWGGGGTLIN